MKEVAILLPYKENFTEDNAAAASIWVKDYLSKSKLNKETIVYGNLDPEKKPLLKNFKNLILGNKILSKNVTYTSKFYEEYLKYKFKIIEIHNRPIYLRLLTNKTNSKFVLYFHNDPLTMEGAKTREERIFLFDNAEKIIFISQWIKKRFLSNLDENYHQSSKFFVIYHSTNKVPPNLHLKENLITFVGKLNKAKGFDLFCKSVIKILRKYPNWKAVAIGDEEREKYYFKHKNLNIMGFIKHQDVLKIFTRTSIAVACSRWEEPLGRTGFEASSRGCAVIISNRGGLPETITNGIILNKLNEKELYKSIDLLIKNKKYRQKLQLLSNKNFHFTHKKSSTQIDLCRNIILGEKVLKINLLNINKSNLKILHVTNFNERYDGRLYFNTGRRINNGFIRNGHSVLEFSDRDIIKNYKSYNDVKGIRVLNNKLFKVFLNYKPDCIILGHADSVLPETLYKIKKYDNDIKISQWFLDPLIKSGPDYINNKKRILDKQDYLDANFLTTSPDVLSFIKDRSKFNFIPNPCDQSFEYLSNYNKNCIYDVFFALSHGVHRGKLKFGKKDDREIFMKNLISITPNIKFEVYGMNNIQPIWADAFYKVLSNCKMGINLSRGNPIKYYSSDRITQIIGNGLLTFVDEGTQYRDFFDDNEMIFYKNIYDLSEKIQKYCVEDNLRKKIAKNGKNKYLKYFNSTLVSRYILEKTYNINSTPKYLWAK